MPYHILNGDALRQQFPAAISGEIIVAREALIDGPVAAESLDAFYTIREAFLGEAYDPAGTYQEKSLPEFKKIEALPADTEVNLWFEDDLFCQVNMWFVAHLLKTYTAVTKVYLIRPTTDLRYGFGGMRPEELEKAFANRQKITMEQLALFGKLWEHFQAHQLPGMIALADSASSAFPFLPAAVQAHIDRYPAEGLGRPEQSLKAIMEELGSDDFGPVFRAFWEREAIYGFGDLQVKRLYDEMKK